MLILPINKVRTLFLGRAGFLVWLVVWVRFVCPQDAVAVPFRRSECFLLDNRRLVRHTLRLWLRLPLVLVWVLLSRVAVHPLLPRHGSNTISVMGWTSQMVGILSLRLIGPGCARVAW